jgi:peroxiredoxin Q/BCP
MAIKTGQRAPDFTLPSTTHERVTLSKLLEEREVVLFFYPKDDSPGCTVEACTFRDEYERFAEAGAEVVGVSDDSVASHERFANKFKLPMKLLSDEGGRVRASYGVKGLFGLPGRVTFVIDRSGIVRHVFDSGLRFAKHVETALDVVRELAGAR